MRNDIPEKLQEWVDYLNTMVKDKTLLGTKFNFTCEKVGETRILVNVVTPDYQSINKRGLFNLITFDIERQGLLIELVYWRFSNKHVNDICTHYECLCEEVKHIKPHNQFEAFIQELDNDGFFNIADY